MDGLYTQTKATAGRKLLRKREEEEKKGSACPGLGDWGEKGSEGGNERALADAPGKEGKASSLEMSDRKNEQSAGKQSKLQRRGQTTNI